MREAHSKRCEACGTIIVRKPRYGIAKFAALRSCSPACLRLILRADPAARFWSNVDMSGGPDACWPWKGNRNKAGYGRFGVNNGSVLAHRYALCLSGRPIPGGKMGCHHCDNPPCCNPAHLYPGTRAENMQDAIARGRAAVGERHPYRLRPDLVARGEGKPLSSKLTEDAVRTIRTSSLPQAKLAELFAVDQSSISNVLRGVTWRHV